MQVAPFWGRSSNPSFSVFGLDVLGLPPTSWSSGRPLRLPFGLNVFQKDFRCLTSLHDFWDDRCDFGDFEYPSFTSLRWMTLVLRGYVQAVECFGRIWHYQVLQDLGESWPLYWEATFEPHSGSDGSETLQDLGRSSSQEMASKS